MTLQYEQLKAFLQQYEAYSINNMISINLGEPGDILGDYVPSFNVQRQQGLQSNHWVCLECGFIDTLVPSSVNPQLLNMPSEPNVSVVTGTVLKDLPAEAARVAPRDVTAAASTSDTNIVRLRQLEENVVMLNREIARLEGKETPEALLEKQRMQAALEEIKEELRNFGPAVQDAPSKRRPQRQSRKVILAVGTTLPDTIPQAPPEPVPSSGKRYITWFLSAIGQLITLFSVI